MNCNSSRLVRWIQTACLWEATAPKAGNVHPDAGFDDLTYDDFVRSAAPTARALAQVRQLGISQVILNAVRETKSEVANNTNLGIILLLAPMVAVKPDRKLSQALPGLLDSLDISDSRKIYEAIRLAQPGGMGEVPEEDLQDCPTQPFREIMRLAADRDMIARQYANSFQDILDFGLQRLQFWWTHCPRQRNQALVGLHLDWIAHVPDSLIQRKCGLEAAKEASRRALAVLQLGWPGNSNSREAFHEFDTWLRDDGHRRNPGTSADLVAATIYAGFHEGLIECPD